MDPELRDRIYRVAGASPGLGFVIAWALATDRGSMNSVW